MSELCLDWKNCIVVFFRDVTIQPSVPVLPEQRRGRVLVPRPRHQEPGREGAVPSVEGLHLPNLRSDWGQCPHSQVLPQEQGREVK